jgi:hypothetical protein
MQTIGVFSETLQGATLLGDHPVITAPCTIASTGTEFTVQRGTVLGKITATGKYAPFDPSAADGSETAKTVALEDIDVPETGDEQTVVLVHGVVMADELVWPSGITDAQKTAALESLSSGGIFNNKGV